MLYYKHKYLVHAFVYTENENIHCLYDVQFLPLLLEKYNIENDQDINFKVIGISN